MPDYCAAFAWPWIDPSDTEKQAKDLFAKLKENRGEFPLEEPHEFALLHSPSGRWLVAVLVLADTPGDDSVRILGGVERWVKQQDGFQTMESVPVRGSSVGSCLPQFEVVDSIR